MRLLGTLPDETLARRLADYLLTLGIGTRVNQEAGTWEVWVRDDDHMPRAKEEWEPFKANPDDPRFQKAEKEATDLKRQEDEAEAQYRRNQRPAAEIWAAPRLGKAPLTIGLIVFCVLVAILTQFDKSDTALMQTFTFGSYQVKPNDDIHIYSLDQDPHDDRDPWLTGLRQGELWRLWTPIFLHFNLAHLVMNMLMLAYLGLMIESRKGTLWLLGFILATGLLTNVCQYFLSPWLVPAVWLGLAEPKTHPVFGGMSGVLFALFGYVWMKCVYDPEPGLYMNRQSVYIMLIWLVLCMTGWVGNIANTAHVTGLLSGMAIGLTRKVWRRFRRREP